MTHCTGNGSDSTTRKGYRVNFIDKDLGISPQQTTTPQGCWLVSAEGDGVIAVFLDELEARRYSDELHLIDGVTYHTWGVI